MYSGTASKPGTKLNILPDFVGRTFIGLSEVILTVQFFFLSSALFGDTSDNFSPDSDISGKNILADLQSSDSDFFFCQTALHLEFVPAFADFKFPECKIGSVAAF